MPHGTLTLTHPHTLYFIQRTYCMCSDWMVYVTEPLRWSADAFWGVKQRGIILCGIKEKLPELEIEHSDQCLAGNSYKPQKILGLALPSVKQTEKYKWRRWNIKLHHSDAETASQSSSVGTGEMIRGWGVCAAEGVVVSSWLDTPAAPTSIQKQVRRDLKGQGQGCGVGGVSAA